MATAIRHSGQTYASKGKLIQSLIDIGNTFGVYLARHDDKPTLHYRLATGEDTFIKFTKFQAIRHLSDSQKQNIATFETVFRLLDCKEKPLRDRIEDIATLKQLRLDCVMVNTACLSIESRSHCVL